MHIKSIYKAEHGELRRLLREMRVQAHLNQADLAALLGRRQSYISAVERGSRRLDLVQLRDYCLACGLDLVCFVQRFERALSSRTGLGD